MYGREGVQGPRKPIERNLARRWVERVGPEALARRGNMSDDDVESLVERAIQESRGQAPADE
jgi:hypothetical protein